MPADNVLTVIRTLEPGDELCVDDTSASRSPPAFRSATRSPRARIAAGEKIMKYGAPIGSATRAIAPGEHVHTHNVRSDYLPTFARGEGAHYEARAAMTGYLRTDGRKGIRNVTRRGVPRGVRASRRARDRVSVSRAGRASARLPRLLPECLRAPHAAPALHASECRRGAARLARLRRLQPRANSSRKSAPPVGPRTRSSSSRQAARGAPSPKAGAGSPRRCAQVDDDAARRLARRAISSSAPSAAAPMRRAASPRIPPSAAPSICSCENGARVDLRGNRRTHRLRADHGRPRRAAGAGAGADRLRGKGRALLHRRWATAASRRATPRAG